MSRVNLDGTALFWMRGMIQRGERGEAENSVTWDHNASDYLQFITVTPVSGSKT